VYMIDIPPVSSMNFILDLLSFKIFESFEVIK
jgi:hypothetical protein